MSNHPRYLRNRQVDPSSAGITGAASTLITVAPTQTSLALDTQAASITSIPFDVSAVVPPTTATLPPAASTSAVASSDVNVPIPIGTVIGACVGAFIGALFLISVGVWFYRRSTSPTQRKRNMKPPLPLTAQSRNLQGENGRNKSRSEIWGKLDDEDDKWEGKYQTKEIDNLAPMEKLTMFKKPASVLTGEKDASTIHSSYELESHPFANGADLKSGTLDDQPTARAYLGRLDTGPPMSWDENGSNNESFLSMSSAARLTRAMSPISSRAIPTPPAVSAEPHRWHSAEVVHFDELPTSDQSSHDTHEAHRRKNSSNNPFFGGGAPAPRRSLGSRKGSLDRTRPSIGSRKSSIDSSVGHRISSKDKGKQKAADPFDDEHELPNISHRFETDSTFSSSAGSERAMQSLIAALEVSPDVVAERLRVASMQPSFLSAETDTPNDEVAKDFPLPPNASQRSD